MRKQPTQQSYSQKLCLVYETIHFMEIYLTSVLTQKMLKKFVFLVLKIKKIKLFIRLYLSVYTQGNWSWIIKCKKNPKPKRFLL